MSTAWWLLTVVVAAIIEYVRRTRGLRAAIVFVSGGAMVLGALATIAIIVYGASRHSRHDGSDILFIAAVFTAIATFVAWIVWIVARSVGSAASGGQPEAIIPVMPSRPAESQAPRPRPDP